MEHPEDNLSNPNDDLAKRRFGVRESLGGSESDEEKKRREEEEEKKKRREQAEKRRREEQERERKAENSTDEQSWFGGDKPSADKRAEGFLGALFGEEAGEKNQKKSDKSSEEAPASATSERSPEETSAEAKQQAPSDQAEAAPVDPEAEAARSAELDPSEKAEAAKAYVAERLKRIDEYTEDAPSDTPETSDDAAESVNDAEEPPGSPVKQFLQRLQQRLDEGGPTALEDDQLDQLAAEVTTTEPEGFEPVGVTPEAGGVDFSTDTEGDSEPETDSLSYEDIDTTPTEDDETDSAIPELDDDDAVVATTPIQPAAGGSSGGGASPPPPTRPSAALPPSGGASGGSAASAASFGAGSAGAVAGASRVVSPSSMAGEAAPRTVTQEVTRGVRSGGEFLLGAFVGYFIGRRRGRNKTEAELAPQQKKIEKELRDVQSSIEAREQALAAAQRRAEQAEQSSQAADAKQAFKATQPSPSLSEAVQSSRPVEAAPAKPAEREAANEASASVSSTEQVPTAPAVEQRPMTEPEQSLGVPVPEILVASTVRSVVESAPETFPEADRSEVVSVERTRESSAASIDSLPSAELLSRAQAVEFRGESLKQMYEAGKVDEATVREVMRLEVRGQSYECLLMRRVAEYEAAQIGQSGEQILDPKPERHAVDPHGAERELEAVGFAGNTDSSQFGAAGAGNTLHHQPADSDKLSGGVNSTDDQTSVAPQVAVGVALGIMFVIMLFWLFG